jgi:hypothetical protein
MLQEYQYNCSIIHKEEKRYWLSKKEMGSWQFPTLWSKKAEELYTSFDVVNILRNTRKIISNSLQCDVCGVISFATENWFLPFWRKQFLKLG